MFLMNIKIRSIKIFNPTKERPRFYLRIDHFHYFISDYIRLQAEQIEVNIEHKLYLPEEKPQFELILLLDSQKSFNKKILGSACFDAREWPIDQQKTKTIHFSQALSIIMSIQNTFSTQILPESNQSSSAQLDLLQEYQKSAQIKSQHNFLKEKNLILKQELKKLLKINKELNLQVQNKSKTMQNIENDRKNQLKAKKTELDEIKEELHVMNLQIGAIINLVNEHGEIDICNAVLDSLASGPEQTRI